MTCVSAISGWLWNIPVVRRILWYPGHHYSPYPSLRDIAQRQERIFGWTDDIPGVTLRKEEQLELLNKLTALCELNPPSFPDVPTPGTRYYYQNPYYGFLDGLLLHLVLRHLRPHRVIEVGSGHSSAMVLDTRDGYLGGDLDLTCIDPFPRRLREQLRGGSPDHCRIISSAVQDVPLSIFAELRANDILFVDSSHVVKTGSDVEWIFRQVLPRVPPGVWVHFHDMYYPFEYLPEQAFSGYAYNEAYCLRSFLQFNSVFQIRLFSSYLWRCVPDAYAGLPAHLRQREPCSIWMQRMPCDT